MDILDVIRKRRSIRKYTGEKIDEAVLDKITQAGLLAPSSRDRRPCSLYVVRDKETLLRLAGAKAKGAKMLEGCDAAVVVAADPDKADTWIEDSSIVMAYMDLEACSLGIGSCWCQFHMRIDSSGNDAEDNVKKILSLPENHRIVGAMAFGIPDEHPEEKKLDERDISRLNK